MALFKWRKSNAIFVPEIDKEHRAVFQAVVELQQAFDGGAPAYQIQEIVHRLISCTEDHFIHEERLMRASRYEAFEWHKQQHDAVRKRMKGWAPLIEAGDGAAAAELIEYLQRWLDDHTAVTDRMMGAYLRNQQRMSHA